MKKTTVLINILRRFRLSEYWRLIYNEFESRKVFNGIENDLFAA